MSSPRAAMPPNVILGAFILGAFILGAAIPGAAALSMHPPPRCHPPRALAQRAAPFQALSRTPVLIALLITRFIARLIAQGIAFQIFIPHRRDSSSVAEDSGSGCKQRVTMQAGCDVTPIASPGHLAYSGAIDNKNWKKSQQSGFQDLLSIVSSGQVRICPAIPGRADRISTTGAP